MKRSALEMKISTGLAELRRSRRLTQQELAKMIGTGRVTIARIETGAAVPSWQFLKRVAQALGAEVEITFKPINDQIPSAEASHPDKYEYICVDCLYRWNSKINRLVMQCPRCHKRQGVQFSEYTKALRAFQNIKDEIKKSPPFKRLPPVRGIRRYAPETLQMILKTARDTFPNPKLPLSLMYRMFEQTKLKQAEGTPPEDNPNLAYDNGQ